MRPEAGRTGALLRAVAAHRWLLSAGLAAAAVATALPVLAPDATATTAVLAAARDLPTGATLAGTDTTVLRLPDGSVPDGALHPGDLVAGSVLAGGVRRGEPLTDVRVVGAGLLAQVRAEGGDQTLVEVPVRLADSAATLLLRTGDRVDVLAAAGSTGGSDVAAPAVVVARDCPVLSVPAPSDAASGTDGALVVLAASPATAARLAGAAASSRLSAVVH